MRELVVKNGMIVEGNFLASGSLYGSSSYAVGFKDKQAFNILLSYLRQQMHLTRSLYQIPNGLVDDFTDTSFLPITGSWLVPYQSSNVANTKSLFGLSCLLHFETIQGTTQSFDSGPLRLSVTSSGNTLINSTQTRVGTGSVYFSGSNTSSLSIGTDFPFNFHTNEDFTIEFNVSCSSQISGTVAGIVNHDNGNSTPDGWRIYKDASNKIQATFAKPSNAPQPLFIDLHGTSDISTGWKHIAVVRRNGIVQVFVNGVMEVQGIDGDPIQINGKPFKMGQGPSALENNPFIGYIDEFRLVKGVAIYSGSLTPPTTSFSDAQYANLAFLSSSVIQLGYIPNRVNAVVVGRITTGSITNLTASVTRDGSNYVNLPLRPYETWSLGTPNTLVYAGSSDLQQQPLGNYFGYKFSNPSGSTIIIESVAFDFQ